MKPKKTEVILWDKVNFKGNFVKLPIGYYNQSDITKIYNILSLKIGPQTSVKLFNQDNCKGDFILIKNQSSKEKEYCSFDFFWHKTIKSLAVFEFGKEKSTNDPHDIVCKDYKNKVKFPWYLKPFIRNVISCIICLFILVLLFKFLKNQQIKKEKMLEMLKSLPKTKIGSIDKCNAFVNMFHLTNILSPVIVVLLIITLFVAFTLLFYKNKK